MLGTLSGYLESLGIVLTLCRISNCISGLPILPAELHKSRDYIFPIQAHRGMPGGHSISSLKVSGALFILRTAYPQVTNLLSTNEPECQLKYR